MANRRRAPMTDRYGMSDATSIEAKVRALIARESGTRPTDRLWMDAELSGDLPDAVEHVRLRIERRHDSPQALHAAAARAIGHPAQFRSESRPKTAGGDQSLPSNIPSGSKASAEISANAIKHAATARW